MSENIKQQSDTPSSDMPTPFEFGHYLKASLTDTKLSEFIYENEMPIIESTKQDELKQAFKLLSLIFKKYGKLPSLAHLKTKADSYDDKRTLDGLLHVEKYNVQTTDTVFLVDEYTKFLVKQSHLLLAQELAFFSHDETRIRKALEKHSSLLKKLQSKPDIITDDFFEMNSVLEEMKNRKVIKSRLPSLDRIIGNGWERGGLFVLVGRTNIGKTMFCVSLARDFAYNGHNVLYINYEGTVSDIKKRLNCGIYDFTTKDLIDNPQAVVDKISAAGKPSGFGELKIQDANNNRSTLYIRHLIDSYKDRGITFDCVVVDQLSKVESPKSGPKDTDYIKLGYVSDELKSIALEYNIVVITPQQSIRGSFKTAMPQLEDGADSINVGRNADCVISIGQTPDMKIEYVFSLSAIKTRYTVSESSCYIGVDYYHQKLRELDASRIDNLMQRRILNGGSLPVSIPKAQPINRKQNVSKPNDELVSEFEAEI